MVFYCLENKQDIIRTKRKLRANSTSRPNESQRSLFSMIFNMDTFGFGFVLFSEVVGPCSSDQLDVGGTVHLKHAESS